MIGWLVETQITNNGESHVEETESVVGIKECSEVNQGGKNEPKDSYGLD